MLDYTTKSYGRNAVVAAIFEHFADGRDVSMPGPRRLGKTFVLDRLVDSGERNGWQCVKVELAGCADTRAVFRRLCEAIGQRRTGGQNAISWFTQRLGQVLSPRSDPSGAWYQPLLSLDYEAWFERLIRAMNDDPDRRWALLIDELPIFLKALHDRGPEGVRQALGFMNLLSRLRADSAKVRWLITGSIGIEPLARAGNYLGVLAKFTAFELEPLSEQEAEDFVLDLASTGRLSGRSALSKAEAAAIVHAVGWRSAYYLDALAQKMAGTPCDESAAARQAVNEAVDRLLQPGQLAAFGIWEEHIRKHHPESDQSIAFGTLRALAPHPQGLSLDSLLSTVARPDLTKDRLRSVLTRLHVEGFLTISDWDGAEPASAFRNPLLRHWWKRFPP